MTERQREALLKTPEKEIFKDMADICGYMEEDGMLHENIGKIKEEAKKESPDMDKIQRLYSAFYDKYNHVWIMYKPYAGYLHALGGNIRHIKTKRILKCNATGNHTYAEQELYAYAGYYPWPSPIDGKLYYILADQSQGKGCLPDGPVHLPESLGPDVQKAIIFDMEQKAVIFKNCPVDMGLIRIIQKRMEELDFISS